MEVLRQQVGAVVDTISAAKAWSRVVVAYEPVWAIGTGHTATAEEVCVCVLTAVLLWRLAGAEAGLADC